MRTNISAKEPPEQRSLRRALALQHEGGVELPQPEHVQRAISAFLALDFHCPVQHPFPEYPLYAVKEVLLHNNWEPLTATLEDDTKNHAPPYEAFVCLNSPVVMDQLLPWRMMPLSILWACVRFNADKVLHWIMAYEDAYPESNANLYQSHLRWKINQWESKAKYIPLLEALGRWGDIGLYEELVSWLKKNRSTKLTELDRYPSPRAQVVDLATQVASLAVKALAGMVTLAEGTTANEFATHKSAAVLSPLVAFRAQLPPGAQQRLQTQLLHDRPDLFPFYDALNRCLSVPRQIEALHQYEKMLRTELQVNSDKPIMTLDQGSMVKVWCPELPWTQAPVADEESTQLVLFRSPRRVPGAPMLVACDQFKLNFEALTGGLLREWDWSFFPMVVAGGAVSTCLSFDIGEGAGIEERVAAMSANAAVGRDIDVFFPCMDVRTLSDRCSTFIQYFINKFGDNVAVLATSRTLTIVPPKPFRRYQVALGTSPSLFDIILNADVDAASVGFDGSEVWMTARGYLSWRYCMNVPKRDLHRIRGSPTYEKRLLKYARRGFSILNIGVTANPDAVSSAMAKLGATPRLQNLVGLGWLLAVERTDVTPKLTNDKDALSFWDASHPAIDIACLIRHVVDVGYAESDNYGQHEEGYVCCIDGKGLHKDLIDGYDVVDLADWAGEAYGRWRPLESTRYPVRPWCNGMEELSLDAVDKEDDHGEELEDEYN